MANKAGQYDLKDYEKFLALMILKKKFRDDVINAVETKDQAKLEDALNDAGITLTSAHISTIMGWPVDDLYWKGYFEVIDLCKQVYDPSSVGCVW